MTKWKPIESFPTDDASFVYSGRERRKFLFYCFTWGITVGKYDIEDQEYYEPIKGVHLRPTHWMELPGKPEGVV